MITIYVDEAQELTQEKWDNIFETVKDRFSIVENPKQEEEKCECTVEDDGVYFDNDDVKESYRDLEKVGLRSTFIHPIPTNVRDFKHSCDWYQSLNDVQFEAVMKHVLICEHSKK